MVSRVQHGWYLDGRTSLGFLGFPKPQGSESKAQIHGYMEERAALSRRKKPNWEASGDSFSLGSRVTVIAMHTVAAPSPKLTEPPKQNNSYSSTHKDSAQGKGNTQRLLGFCRREGCSGQCCEKTSFHASSVDAPQYPTELPRSHST